VPLFRDMKEMAGSNLAEYNSDSADRVASKGHQMQLVYGADSAFAISLRNPGYHSSPHIHDYEQLNYIQEGEMWFFVHDKGYHVKKGDSMRIPRNAIHWSWVKTDEPCLCYEVFSPPPPPKQNVVMDSAQALFDEENENPVTRPSIGIYFVDMAMHGLNQDKIESQPAANR
jgi:mannose-6-phosphate isomerase-like protein (cupin superfamily)